MRALKSTIGIFLLLLSSATFADMKKIRSYSNDSNYTLYGEVQQVTPTPENAKCVLYFQIWISASSKKQKELDPGQYSFDLCTTKIYDWGDFTEDLQNKRLPDSMELKLALKAAKLVGKGAKPDRNKNPKIRKLEMESGKIIMTSESEGEIAVFSWVQEET